MPSTTTKANTPIPTSTALTDLRRGAEQLVRLGIPERQQILVACIAGVEECWEQWVEAAWEAKRIRVGDVARAEDITTGLLPTLRCLRLLHQTLEDIKHRGKPRLPAKPYLERGHLRVSVFPTRSLFDKLLFGPIKALVRMPKSASVDNLFGDSLKKATGCGEVPPTVALVLGAGNVSSIPITDALTKIFQANQAVLLKMNPVNEYVGPVFERAFAPLIKNNLLRIVYGGADVGAALISAEAVDCVHITGSDRTHDAIVWGGSAEEQAQRKSANTPLLQKPITSELGNVSPWIIVPGSYTEKQLKFQAENIVASVTTNASFVCIATKMLITHKDWPQREQFLNMIDEILATVPTRFAYYPGATERYARFAGVEVETSDNNEPGNLPWKFRRDVDPDALPFLFKEESFVCVFGETALDAKTPSEFLDTAVDFANDQMWGTLSAALTVPQDFQRDFADEFEAAVDRLQYGTVGINQWPGVGFGLMSTPWGAFPGSTLQEIKSGIGSVHNTYLLNNPEQTVISSPLTMFPKPMWFSTHRCPEVVATKLIKFYMRPTIWRIPSLLISAMRG